MKRLRIKAVTVKMVAIMLAALTLCSLFSACAKKEEAQTVMDVSPVLECGGIEIPVFFYEFMLSRVRADLARNGNKVTDPDFWYATMEGTDKTREQYYNEYALEACKSYLAAAVLFDEEELELPESKLEQIEEDIGFYIEYDGDHDTDAFNKIISPFGVDVEALRRCYIIEAKYEYLKNYLYGDGELISETVKEEYYKNNYVRFKQILFRKVRYEFEYDYQNNLVYFDPETSKPLYDTENGTYRYDEKGYYIRDDYEDKSGLGQIIYFDSNGVILYDKENGSPAEKLDENGNAVKYEYTAEENAVRSERAQTIANGIAASDFEAFEKKMAEIAEEELLFETYKDGYYLSKSENVEYTQYPYINTIVAELKTMEVGDVSVVETEHGYHVIMKYELEDGKYSQSEYEDFFGSLSDEIINDLFTNKLSGVLATVNVNGQNLKKAKSITRIGTNYDY